MVATEMSRQTRSLVDEKAKLETNYEEAQLEVEQLRLDLIRVNDIVDGQIIDEKGPDGQITKVKLDQKIHKFGNRVRSDTQKIILPVRYDNETELLRALILDRI